MDTLSRLKSSFRAQIKIRIGSYVILRAQIFQKISCSYQALVLQVVIFLLPWLK